MEPTLTRTQQKIKGVLRQETETLKNGPPNFERCCPYLDHSAAAMDYVLKCNKIEPSGLKGAALPSAFRQNEKQGRAAFEFKVYDQCKGLTICGESPRPLILGAPADPEDSKPEECYICGFPINQDGGDYADAPRGRQCEHVLTVLTIALLCGLSNQKYDTWVDNNDRGERGLGVRLAGLPIWEKFKSFRQELIHGMPAGDDAKNNQFAWDTGVAGKEGQAYKWSHPACNLIKNEYPFLTVLFDPVKGPYIYTPPHLENSIIFVLKELLFSFRDDAMNWRKSREVVVDERRALDLGRVGTVFLVDDSAVGGYNADNSIVAEGRSKSKRLKINLFPNVALTSKGDIPKVAFDWIVERYNHIREKTIEPIYDVLIQHWEDLSYYSAFANTMLLSVMQERSPGVTRAVKYFSSYLSSSRSALQSYKCSSTHQPAFQTATSLIETVLSQLSTFIPTSCQPAWMGAAVGGGKREKRKKSSIYRRRRKNKKKIYRSRGGSSYGYQDARGTPSFLERQWRATGHSAWAAALYVADPTALQPYESDEGYTAEDQMRDGSEPHGCDLTDWQACSAIAKATALVATDMIDHNTFRVDGYDWLQSVLQLDASCAAGVTSGSLDLQSTTSLAEIDRRQQEVVLARSTGEWAHMGHTLSPGGRLPPQPPPPGGNDQDVVRKNPLSDGWNWTDRVEIVRDERDGTEYTAVVYWKGVLVDGKWKSNYLLEFGNKNNPNTYEARYSYMLQTLESIEEGELYTELYNTALYGRSAGCWLKCDDGVTSQKEYTNETLMNNKLNAMFEIAKQFRAYVSEADHRPRGLGAQKLENLRALERLRDRERQRKASKEVNQSMLLYHGRDEEAEGRPAKRGGGGGGKKSRRKYNKKKRTRRKYRNKVNKSKQKLRRTRRTRRTRRRNTKK